MLSNRRPISFEPIDPTALGPHDAGHWLRKITAKRRLVNRTVLWRHREVTRALLAETTLASFRLDGLEVAREHVRDALAANGRQRNLRSRQFRRLRNHVAILQQIEIGLRHHHTLKPTSVVRWYTSISSGLSTTALADAPMARLTDALRRMNCPQLRLQGAVQECARLHHQLLHDPLVPGFNGILARLLLHHHLGRCNLPPVLFDPISDPIMTYTESALAGRLLQLIDSTYDRLIALIEPRA